MNRFFVNYHPYRNENFPGGWALWFGRKTGNGGFIARGVAFELPTKPTRRQMRQLHKRFKKDREITKKNLRDGL